MPKELIVIASRCFYNGVGYLNPQPWTSSEGAFMQYVIGSNRNFHKFTGLVMGRRTWDSHAHTGFPNHLCVVITHRPFQSPGVTCAPSVEDAIFLLNIASVEQIIFIGGNSILTHVISRPDCIMDRMYLIDSLDSIRGDTVFPTIPAQYKKLRWILSSTVNMCQISCFEKYVDAPIKDGFVDWMDVTFAAIMSSTDAQNAMQVDPQRAVRQDPQGKNEPAPPRDRKRKAPSAKKMTKEEAAKQGEAGTALQTSVVNPTDVPIKGVPQEQIEELQKSLPSVPVYTPNAAVLEPKVVRTEQTPYVAGHESKGYESGGSSDSGDDDDESKRKRRKKAEKKPKKPLSEEEKKVLRERLEKARAAKKAKKDQSLADAKTDVVTPIA